MKAVRLYAAGDLRVEDIAGPEAPAPGHVVLAVSAAGICGSDLHNFRTGQWISRSPSVAGHEFAGVVTAIGDGVQDVSVGDTVIADSRCTCGDCTPCRDDRGNVCAHLGFVGEVCDGGFAQQVEMPARLLVRYDPAIDAAVAAMSEPLAVALHAVRRLNPRAGFPVLIAGCGPIGGLAAVLLSRLHDGAILVADRNADRVERVCRVTGALPVALERDALTLACAGQPLLGVIDATGNIAVITQLLDLVAPGASIALVGITHGRLDLDPNILVEREIALIGCHAFNGELAEAVSLLGAIQPMLQALIDAEIGLDAVPAAYRRLLDGHVAGLKTIIRP